MLVAIPAAAQKGPDNMPLYNLKEPIEAVRVTPEMWEDPSKLPDWALPYRRVRFSVVDIKIGDYLVRWEDDDCEIVGRELFERFYGQLRRSDRDCLRFTENRLSSAEHRLRSAEDRLRSSARGFSALDSAGMSRAVTDEAARLLFRAALGYAAVLAGEGQEG